ncbi:MAG: 2-succinyl-5-enolpyruvyl-6-hydroxy-3-cyclohexene-1-carboxylic-acid synthase [Prevotella sp.]|nr:2-succinyl-5-enolpyruvyl-6-hydroxy-3-cyclohexene-1-carboxylic-acid synthase [Prevotella sp.]
MYSDKANINILTSLMVAHGVRTVVVCPGSRNAPLAHNFSVCRQLRCISVTDERSAGFYAIGLSLASGEPVAVCVTSGSALLNLAPAVCEAYYREIPLLVISADRPQAMIGQLQGQTMVQTGALAGIVRHSVTLPEPADATAQWFCNRLVNEALSLMVSPASGPVHVNVPVSEPLFGFSAETLPEERVVRVHRAVATEATMSSLAACVAASPRLMVVVGQLPFTESQRSATALERLRGYAVVLTDHLASDCRGVMPSLDRMAMLLTETGDYAPDTVVYVGGNMVSKSMRSFLQGCRPANSYVVTADGKLTDVLMTATDIVEATPSQALDAMAAALNGKHNADTAWTERWHGICVQSVVSGCDPEYSQVAAVREFFKAIDGSDCCVHLANSMSVRAGLLYADRYVYVNRGVNGIEGSLSTAAGFSLMSAVPVYCVIGDLSFFYDVNALWHGDLCGNFRILLLNNGCGGIFRRFRKLEDSPALDGMVMARHNTSAEGACQQNGVAYRAVHEAAQLADGIRWLTHEQCPTPMLLEVFTDDEEDQRVYDSVMACGHRQP